MTMNNEWNIEELVLRVQQGDEAAFEELVKRYEKLVYYIALPKMENQADTSDIVQETFIEVKKSISQLKEPKYFKSWLNKVVLSKIARHYEKQRDCLLNQHEEQVLYRQREQRVYMNPKQAFNYLCNQEILDGCMKQLKNIYRDVLTLQYYEGLSMAEIAMQLEIPEGTVKSRLSVAKKELRKIIEATLEQEQIYLNFDSVGLEALLAVYFAKRITDTGLASTAAGAQTHSFRTKLHQKPMLQAILSATLVVGAISTAYYFIDRRNTSDYSYQEDTQASSAPAFPEFTYRGKLISNAREAYGAVYDSVFNNNSFDDEYKALVQVLNDYGGEYASMARYLENNFNQKQEK